jgi:hypothetical protein
MSSADPVKLNFILFGMTQMVPKPESLNSFNRVSKKLKGIRIGQVIYNRQSISIEIKEGIVFPR